MGKLAWMGSVAALTAVLLVGIEEVRGGSGGSSDPRGSDDRLLIYERLRNNDNEGSRELIERHLEHAPDDAVMLYNAACVECRLGAVQPAARYLIRAVQAGFADFSHLRRDADLRPLREHPVYRAIVAARRAADEALTHRRLDEWRQRFGHGSYRYETDPDRRFAFVTALDDDAHAAAGRLLRAANSAASGSQTQITSVGNAVMRLGPSMVMSVALGHGVRSQMKDEGDALILEKIDPGKRDFVRNFIKGTAFAVPVVASFSMDGLMIGGVRPAHAGYVS